MSRIYDNWERLVEATLRRDQFRSLALAESRNSSFRSIQSEFNFDLPLIADDAVVAVASVVFQKLRDLISEGSFTHNKIIESQLREMQEGLEQMRGFFIDAADKETNVEDIKKWTDDYLHNLCYVEDTIESFSLRITRQRKRLGFLMNHALFLRNFTACKKLSRKLEKIQKRIKKLNSDKPAGVEEASLRSIRSQQSDYDVSFNLWVDSETLEEMEEGEVEMEEENEEKRVEMETYSSVDFDTDDPSPKMRRSISGGSTNSSTKGSKRSLLSSCSMKMRSNSDVSLIRERWQQSKLMHNYSYDEKELEIVGFENDVPELLSRLTQEEYWGEQIISIVGELGSGKTILTRAVYGNRFITNWFETCAWATIFEESDMKDLLLNLLKQVQKSEEQGGANSEESLKIRLQQHLKNKRYLIVLDGISSISQWESLKNAFPDDNKNGSKIIITTRDKQVVRLAGLKGIPHDLKKLGCEESWNLFLNKVGLEEGPEGLKKKFFDVCNGLPLNIVLLGSLLSTKKDRGYREWNSILGSQDNWQTSDIFGLSYNDLDAHLKRCLLYLTLFPKEFDIPVRRLQRLWLAEGFVKRPQSQDRFLEDLVQEYFDNLVKRSLILVSKLRSDGSPRKCRLLGVLHDFLLAKAQDISLFHVHRNSVCPEEVDGPLGKRRLIEYADAKNCSLSYSHYKHLRSYISFNVQKKDTPAKYVGSFLNNVIGKGFGLLRVLDLEGVYKPGLPDNLGDLFHLRYLGLRWTFLDKLPNSVGCLPFLETLDLKHTYINRIPPSIWKLKHLRHLNLNEIRLDKDMPLHSRRSFPQLLTLWGLSVDHESPIKNGWSKLTQLRELGISFRLSQCDDKSSDMNGLGTDTHFTEDLVDWITKLTSLQSLRLRSKDDMGCPSQLNLKPFSDLNKLSDMNLLGKLQKLPDLNHFPPNIRVLTLSVSRLDKDPMSILGQLQSLTVLRLLANSYLGENILCTSGTFQELRVLKLWMLKDLKKWELEEGAMEKLKELNIECCSKLENIPNRLFQHRTFKDLILTNMPEEFKRKVEMKNISNVSIAVKNYEFTPLPWEQEDDFSNGVASNHHNYPNGRA